MTFGFIRRATPTMAVAAITLIAIVRVVLVYKNQEN